MAKRRIYISDHGNFNMFGMSVSLPAIIELEDDQISRIRESGMYNVLELSAQQKTPAKQTALSEVEGDRFDTAKTISVNVLSSNSPSRSGIINGRKVNIIKLNSLTPKYLLKGKSATNNSTQSKIINRTTTYDEVPTTKINTTTVDKTTKATVTEHKKGKPLDIIDETVNDLSTAPKRA